MPLISSVLLAALTGAQMPPLVEQAAVTSSRDIAKTIVYRYEQSYNVRFGRLYQQSLRGSFAIASKDDRTIAARALALQTNGHPASDADVRKAEQGFLDNPPLHEPFDARYLAEYAYSVEGSTVQFRALARDESHADGSFATDAAGHVTSITYSPCVMPYGASHGTVTETRAETAPGYWGLRSVHAEFSGRRLLIPGSFVMDATVERVDLFPTADAAVEAVKSVDRNPGTR